MKITLSTDKTKYNIGDKVFVRAPLFNKDGFGQLPYFEGEVENIDLSISFLPQAKKFGELYIDAKPRYKVKPDLKYQKEYNLRAEYYDENFVFRDEEELQNKFKN